MFKTKAEKRAFLKQSIKMADLESDKLSKNYNLEKSAPKRLDMVRTIRANGRSIKHLNNLLNSI